MVLVAPVQQLEVVRLGVESLLDRKGEALRDPDPQEESGVGGGGSVLPIHPQTTLKGKRISFHT